MPTRDEARAEPPARADGLYENVETTGKEGAAGPSAATSSRRSADLRDRRGRWLLAASVGPPAAVIACRAAGAGGVTLFAVSAAALLPLAWTIGELTERLAEQTSGKVAAFFNATVGNAPELIIALVAVAKGLPAVVRASLAGSVAANVLLVLGLALLVRRGGGVGARTVGTSLALIVLAAVALAVPSASAALGVSQVAVTALSVVAAIAVATAYVAESRRRLRAGLARAAGTEAAASVGSARRPVILLALAMLLTVGVAEALVGSVEVFAQSVGLEGFFVAAVLVALVGNAVEHGAAVVLAWRGRIDLAAEIAVSSAAQVAALLIPVSVLAVSLAAAGPPTFGPLEVAAVGAPAVLAGLVLSRERRRGALLLIGAYAAFAILALVPGAG